MLVIRRRAGESLQIGDDIEIEVIECGPQRVKLGIRAPREIEVMRNEVRLTRDQNVAAARSIALGSLPGVLRGLANPKDFAQASGTPGDKDFRFDTHAADQKASMGPA